MIDVYIDGASAGDPGPSGAGVFINFKNGNVENHSIPLGEMSNHEAEYEALIIALDLCIERGVNMVSFRTDSKLIDDAIEKRYVKNKRFQPYLEKAIARIEQFDLFFIKWVPSNQNKQADSLARKAIREN
ncbi:reverse transcriptase-like protein [Alkalihalobacillus sp. MEB130]|uniref:reverse transcriptase-like protein n=1 Tax=Alkalihalobacillus sp. MEB130 TaxID=2976704 RepID=UPI0028DECBF8|nr:reverse transcriptase-like protein [Alkalihalobacillus sp. MEB130]MDT8859901.1 reverse transcriptase-like protein [Alkalihalobacillus sp. MEB130]